MPWTPVKVNVLPRIYDPSQSAAVNDRLKDLLKRVEITFQSVDGNGVIVTHVAPFNDVSDASTAGVARLMRDQLNQLNAAAAIVEGSADIDTLMALAYPVPPDDPAAAVDTVGQGVQKTPDPATAIVEALQLRVAHLKAIQLGIATDQDPDVIEVKQQLDDAMKSDRDLVLSLIP